MKEAFATEARCAALLRGVAWPGRPFLIDGLSHAQLHRQAGRLYHFFQRTGQKAPICLASDDKPVCAAALLAALAGGPPLFLPYALSPQALSALQAAGGCIQALCTPELELPKGMQRLPLPEELGEDENPLPAIPAQGPILHLFTGGSTGAPQLWSKTAANLFGEALFIASHHGITAEDRIAASILPYHIYGLLYSVLLPLVSGAAVLAESPSFPEEMVAAVRGRDISILISVPAHYRALAGRSCAPSALRLAFSSAGMLDAADNQAFCQANQVGVVEVYGSTETGGIACRNRFLGEEDFTILPPIAWRQSPEERLMLRSPFLSPELALDQEGFFHAADRIAPKSGNSFSLLGRAEEIKLPDVSAIMQEHKALGMVGKIELPAGFDKLEGEIKWNSLYKDVAKTVANPYKAVQLQCRSNIETYGAQGRLQEVSLVTYLTVMFKKNPLGTFKQHDNAEFGSGFSATYIKQVIDGDEVLELDYLANIFRVGGEDMLETYRANIGG